MKLPIVFLVSLCLQAEVVGSLGKATAGKSRERSASFASERSASFAATEMLAREMQIPPGVSTVESKYDIGGVERVSVAITTFDSGTLLTKLRIGVAWANDTGDWYVITDLIRGSGFAFTDHGGFNVAAHGRRLKLVIFNDGDAPVLIRQLSMYAPAQQ